VHGVENTSFSEKTKSHHFEFDYKHTWQLKSSSSRHNARKTVLTFHQQLRIMLALPNLSHYRLKGRTFFYLQMISRPSQLSVLKRLLVSKCIQQSQQTQHPAMNRAKLDIL